jgi:hypothetical protein
MQKSVSYSSDEGDRFWYRSVAEDILHRTDGPAVEYADGNKEWWLNGERINCNSQKEFERYLGLIAFE